jgi:hypothetical protein
MQSIFTDKASQPEEADLKKALGKTYPFWKEIEEYTLKTKKGAVRTWNYSGLKFGWSCRINDSRRVLIYLLPRDEFFKTGFVFGEKAYKEIMSSKINGSIKASLKAARPFAEGRGIRIIVDSKKTVKDIKQLVEIKIKY